MNAPWFWSPFYVHVAAIPPCTPHRGFCMTSALLISRHQHQRGRAHVSDITVGVVLGSSRTHRRRGVGQLTHPPSALCWAAHAPAAAACASNRRRVGTFRRRRRIAARGALRRRSAVADGGAGPTGRALIRTSSVPTVPSATEASAEAQHQHQHHRH